VWQSGGVLFLALKMSQDPVDDVLVLNACDDPDRTTAASANARRKMNYLRSLQKELAILQFSISLVILVKR
jgi:hypothetical protein